MDAKSNSQASFDRQAATYDVDRNGSHARKAYKPILTEILAQNYSSLLDVGAGTGEMLRMLINARPEARYAGIDLAENMLKAAGEKLGRSADLLQGDAEKLPLPGHSFDIIICNDSFHHYPNPATALAEFKRVLNPGGMLAHQQLPHGIPAAAADEPFHQV